MEQIKKAESQLKPCPFCGKSVEIVICDDEGKEVRHTGEDVWSGVRGLNAALPCLSLHPSEEAAWNAMLAFLARWRDKAAAMGYAPVGGGVECQEEFHEWHAHCDFDFAGREVRMEGRLHAVNRF